MDSTLFEEIRIWHRICGEVKRLKAKGKSQKGDGYGMTGIEALRCETSPVAFEAGVVIALGGRDTGSSQVFVTLGPAPHLDGEYAVIGKATGPWEFLAEGDRIRTARID